MEIPYPYLWVQLNEIHHADKNIDNLNCKFVVLFTRKKPKNNKSIHTFPAAPTESRRWGHQLFGDLTAPHHANQRGALSTRGRREALYIWKAGLGWANNSQTRKKKIYKLLLRTNDVIMEVCHFGGDPNFMIHISTYMAPCEATSTKERPPRKAWGWCPILQWSTV